MDTYALSTIDVKTVVTARLHTMRLNRCYSRSGHLWQNRFYSCPLGPTHLVAALAYVDLNPVRAGLVGKAAHYPWSSAGAHAAGADSAGLLDKWECVTDLTPISPTVTDRM